VDGDYGGERYSRVPTLEDLAKLCSNLNRFQVKYVVIGGFAVIRHGYIRATADIDLLVEDSPANVHRLRTALAYLPDAEAHQISDTDLAQYRVVRVAGEIAVDLLAKACEVTYALAESHIQYDEIHGVVIPFLNPEMLIETKQGVRAKDVQDRQFLHRLLRK
jgi:hypothetical protein